MRGTIIGRPLQTLRRECTVTVEDGILDIEFQRNPFNPKISAIEIERRIRWLPIHPYRKVTMIQAKRAPERASPDSSCTT